MSAPERANITESDMNWGSLKANWKQFKDRLKERWRSRDASPTAPRPTR